MSKLRSYTLKCLQGESSIGSCFKAKLYLIVFRLSYVFTITIQYHRYIPLWMYVTILLENESNTFLLLADAFFSTLQHNICIDWMQIFALSVTLACYSMHNHISDENHIGVFSNNMTGRCSSKIVNSCPLKL